MGKRGRRGEGEDQREPKAARLDLRVTQSNRSRAEWLALQYQASSLSNLIEELIASEFDKARKAAGFSSLQEIFSFIERCENGKPPSDLEIIQLGHQIDQLLGTDRSGEILVRLRACFTKKSRSVRGVVK